MGNGDGFDYALWDFGEIDQGARLQIADHHLRIAGLVDDPDEIHSVPAQGDIFYVCVGRFDPTAFTADGLKGQIGEFAAVVLSNQNPLPSRAQGPG